MRVTKIVADMMGRREIRGITGNNGYFACEYCTCRGEITGSTVYWPYPQGLAGEPRDPEVMKRIARYNVNILLGKCHHF